MTRNHKKIICFTKEEHDHIDEAANKEHTSFTEFVRVSGLKRADMVNGTNGASFLDKVANAVFEEDWLEKRRADAKGRV